MAMTEWLIEPDWPAPANVRGFATTRLGGVSESPWHSLNLGDHVGDEPAHVQTNRERLAAGLGMPSSAFAWLHQVHGTAVADADQADAKAPAPHADASISRQAGPVCAVLTADCLPVLFCDVEGRQVAAAHAGWRGLCDGVLEATLNTFPRPAQVMAWLGPAIGPRAFEVGPEVRRAFIEAQPAAVQAFVPSSRTGHWLADLYQLARLRLQRAAVTGIYGGHWCTLEDSDRFYSYRRDGVTGRMASGICRLR